MRVFVTGASGFVGSAVVRELIGAGHEVLGLVRSDAGAESVSAAGGRPLRGSLEDLDSLRRGAAESDGVIHTGFIHDFTNFAHSLEVDRDALDALGTTLAGTGKPLVISSGCAGVPQEGRPLTEEDPTSSSWPRIVSDDKALSYVDRGVRVSVMRLPIVHGEGDHGFLSTLVGIAREKGVSAYLGDGSNGWPAVHRLDAARLFRLACESARAGTHLHAVADEGVRFREIAEVVGRHLDVPVRSVPVEQAGDHFGWLGAFATVDMWVSSALTRERFGWHPVQPELLPDLEKGHYFTA